MKAIVRKQTSARPAKFEASKIKKRQPGPRGGKKSIPNKRTKPGEDFYVVKAHRNSQVRSALSKVTFKEKRRLALSVTGTARREREQLCSLGKLRRERSVKTEFNVPERWAGHVPFTVPFTIEGLLRAMVRGIVKPLYSLDGKPACGSAE